MMINNIQMINKMNENQMLETIQKNNEQIIQMIQQIFQVQILNNMILNKIISNNNNTNNNLNNLMNQMNNFMNNNMMNMANNDNIIDPWPQVDISLKINICFELTTGKKLIVNPPIYITVNELIEGFIKKFNIEKQYIDNVNFLYNGRSLKMNDCTKIKDIGMVDGDKVLVIEKF